MNIALIGFGYWGPNLARNWNLNRRINFKYICDIKAERRQIASVQYPGVKIIEDYHELINDPAVDAVNIVTPIENHYQIAKDALLAGKHVLVEKPLTASKVQADELKALAEKNGLVIMVGHTFLYSPPVHKVHQYIQDGTLGSLDFIQLTRINLGRVKHDYNVIWDLAPHDFSILEYWTGQRPQSIQVLGKASTFKGVCDVAFINLRYDHDLIANIHLSWISPVKLRQSYVVGHKQMVVYDDTHPTEKIKLYDMGIELKEPSTFGEFQLSYRSGDIHIPHLEAVEPLSAECNHFIDCVESNLTPRTHIDHAIRIVEMIEAAQESLKKNGETVYL